MLGQDQIIAGLGVKDLALLAGGIALVVALLLIGISGDAKRRGLLFYLGLIGLILSCGAIGYGSIHRGSSQASA